MGEELSMDDFLGHETSSAGSRTNYLGNWKKDPPHYKDVLLHTKAPIVAVWQMAFPRIVEREKDGVQSVEVWGGKFNTWEPADVCKKQYRRDRNTGERELPPTICPFQLFLEKVRSLIDDGTLDWTEALFHFEGDDPRRATTLHSGGMLGLYGGRDETPEQKQQLAQAGIRGSESWKEKCNPKCNYVFVVADPEDPTSGVLVATETTLLGDKVKEAIKDEITSQGGPKGNPMLNPYVIRWQHQPKEKEFNKKYKAIVMRAAAINPATLKLITETDAPTTKHITGRGNPVQLRADMESFYVGPEGLFDWDEIFAPSEAIWNADKAAADDVVDAAPGPHTQAVAQEGLAALDVAQVTHSEPAKEDAPKAAPKRRKAKAKVAEDPMEALRNRVLDPADQASCIECEKVIHNDDEVCPFCGYDYREDEVAAAPEPPAKPAPKKRAAKAKAAEIPTPADVPAEDEIPF